MAVWIKTNFKGVRYREHENRKHGVKLDRYFSIRYKLNGKGKEEGLGWASENMSASKAYDTLKEIKENIKRAKGPQSLEEKRTLLKERKAAEKAAQALAESAAVTFGQYFENEFFPVFEVGRKTQTTRKAKEHFKNWLEPVIGNIPLKDIKPFALEKVKKSILDAGKSPRTLQYVMATFRQVWNMARRDERIEGDSPSKAIKIPKVDNKRVRFLSIDEAETLLNALKEADTVTHDMALLSLNCGLRFGEIAALKWGHIDIDRGMIEIVDPKGNQGRVAFMTNKAKVMFSKMTRRGADDYIFANEKGVKFKDPPRVFHDVVEALGLNDNVTDSRRKVVFHTCRHTFASWHVTAGTDIYAVKSLLGHSNISMTERYSHLAPETLQNATRTLEKAIRAGHKKAGEVINFKK